MLSTLVPFCLVLCGLLVHSSVIPQAPEVRVIDLQPPPLDDGRKSYDHEAFLGKEQSEAFNNLSSEESKKRLAIIFGKIDENGDGLLTSQEIEDWIEYVQLRYIRKNVEKQWRTYDGQENGSIKWGHFKEKTYDDESTKEGFRFAANMKRDLRRWKQADQDQNEHLSIEEFTDFVHPEESEHMKELVVQETLEDIDKDKDGKISLDEYLKDIWHDEKDPEEWLEREKKMFQEHRDLNKDGFMDNEEVRAWILPDHYNYIEAEASHLLYASDANKDGMLDLQEVLDNYDVFVGSQATDFGDAILDHDEF